ncbi:MAG: ABC-type transport auxiliary lipoprotein family protein [Caulobacter sp.]|nr:ABC-type transport auxiliary lipoprotein family protein [Caulobacter sp.]
MTRRLTAAALALAALALSGCVTLFPDADPAQLYRFEANVAASPAAAGPRIGILRLQTAFPRAAGGDRILTISGGGEAAYIAGARWVSPASVLFDEQLTAAFQGAGRARLINRGEVVKADYMMKLDVQRFETRYDQGAKAAPQVVITVRGVITRNTDRAVVGEQVFTAEVRAGDNRVRDIVPAYDQALSQVLGEVVLWANAVDAPAR